MKSITKPMWNLCLLVSVFLAPDWLCAQGTAFTYQGRLSDSGSPASGNYDLTFQLFNAATNGAGVGPILTNNATGASNGLFTVTLDFGAGIFNGPDYWLEIGVRSNGSAGGFTTLSPLQELTPAPYAVYAGTASNISGILPAADLSGVYGNAVLLSNVANSFSGNGAGLANVNAATVGGLSAAQFWNLTGNAGTTPGINFVGTKDNQPLQLWANGARALLLDGTADPTQPNVIGGSSQNSVTGSVGATIGGGNDNTIQADNNWCTIAGGVSNAIQLSAGSSTIAGGGQNIIETNAVFSTIGGGSDNTIEIFANNSTIGGGAYNTIQAITNGGFDSDSTIAGGDNNTIQYSIKDATIGGGGANTIQAGSWNSTIAGGFGNSIQILDNDSTIAGGYQNTIQSFGNVSTIAGGNQNTIETVVYGGTIGGGGLNTIQLDNFNPTIAGGIYNTIEGHAEDVTISGGESNTNDGSGSTIAGGYLNTIQASARESTISGGAGNTIEGYNADSTIAGGYENTIQTDATYAVIPDGFSNLVAGSYSFAAGQQAQALHNGAFVWADSQNTNFASTADDQFIVRAQGGVVFTDGNGNAASWTPGGGSWNFSSDRNLKDRFAPVDEASVLDKVARLPMAEWSYKGHEQRHIGAMAQDFHALFPLNDNDKVLNDTDLHGVELAAIKGLNQKVNAKDAEIQTLKQENESLQKRLEALEQAVQPLLARLH